MIALDYRELTRIAQSTPEPEAQAAHEAAMTAQELAEDGAQQARDKTARLRARRAALGDMLTTARALGNASAARAYEEAIASEALDLKRFAAQSLESLQYANFLRDTVSYLDADAIPQASLQEQRARCSVTMARAECLSAEALLLAVRKNAALQELAAIDGEAVVTPSGRAYEAFSESLTWHRRSAQEQDRLEAAEAALTKQKQARDQK